MIGEKVRRAMTVRGMDVRDLADRLDTTPQSVYRWLRGEVEPSIRTLRMIARITDHPIPYFFSEIVDSRPTRNGILQVTIDGVVVLKMPVLPTSNIDVDLSPPN